MKNSRVVEESYYVQAIHLNGRDAASGLRGKRAMDGAAPELGQDDPLREKRNSDAVSCTDPAPAPALEFAAKPSTAVSPDR